MTTQIVCAGREYVLETMDSFKMRIGRTEPEGSYWVEECPCCRQEDRQVRYMAEYITDDGSKYDGTDYNYLCPRCYNEGWRSTDEGDAVMLEDDEGTYCMYFAEEDAYWAPCDEECLKNKGCHKCIGGHE